MVNQTLHPRTYHNCDHDCQNIKANWTVAQRVDTGKKEDNAHPKICRISEIHEGDRETI